MLSQEMLLQDQVTQSAKYNQPKGTQWHRLRWSHTAWLIATLLLLTWGGQRAWAQQSEWQGIIETMPASGLIGPWTVQGRSFTSDANTDLRQDKGAFAVGVCVEVEYVGSTAPFTATKIASKNADDCVPSPTDTPTGQTATPLATGTSTAVTGTPVTGTPATGTPVTGTPVATPSATVTLVGEQEAFGTVDSIPAPGFVGTWVINSVSYDAPASAEFKQRNGPLVVGACVKVHYSPTSTPFTVREIESATADRCANATPTASATPTITGTITGTPAATPSATSTPSATTTPSGESERYGRIETMPAGRIGLWSIQGVAYTATASSEFKEEHGALVVGGCVKIHVLTTTTPATIRELESEQEFRCSSGGGSNPTEGELYGVIQSFPAGLSGDWNIGGMSFVADSATEFSQKNSAFAVGVTVKVHFVIDASGVMQAREIESKFANDSSGNDDDGNGSFEGAEGHAYGTIDSFPAALQGPWQIGGLVYTTTATTHFEQTTAAFAVGGKVRVRYYLNAQGSRLVQKIESTTEDGGASVPTHVKFFGYVSQLPASGFNGTWTINSLILVADATSKFQETNGLLSIGAYVAVEYSVQNGHNQIHELESHVPPGAGANTAFGKIDDKGGTVQAQAAALNASWLIGGVSYSVTPATDLVDVQSELTVGKSVLVNSYAAPDGTQVATQIRGIALNRSVYLPLVRR